MSFAKFDKRMAYYLGITLLVLNAFPAAREYLSFIYDYEVITGLTAISVIAILTAIGAFFAYKRKYI